jgi:hypothetical protein
MERSETRAAPGGFAGVFAPITFNDPAPVRWLFASPQASAPWLRCEAPPAVAVQAGAGVTYRTEGSAAAMQARWRELTAPEGPAPARGEQPTTTERR